MRDASRDVVDRQSDKKQVVTLKGVITLSTPQFQSRCTQ